MKRSEERPEDTLRFGLVGAGRISHSYVDALQGDQRNRLVAVADTRVDAARALAALTGCEPYSSYVDMCKQARLDAVIVCTPPQSHPEIGCHFLERNIHVLCEKPLSIDRANAVKMIDTAREHGVLLTMASKFRYVEDVTRAKQLVTAGVIGDVILFENEFASNVSMASRWNSQAAISGGGVLIDNGTHSLDLLRYFLGPVAEVQVLEGKRIQGLSVEETVCIFVRTASGVMANIDLSWSIHKELDSYIRIYGTQGTIMVGWKESKYRLSHSAEWTVFGSGYNKVHAFRGQLRNFANAIRGGEPVLVTPEDALASVEVVEAAYASLRQNNWTAVARPLPTQHPIIRDYVA